MLDEEPIEPDVGARSVRTARMLGLAGLIPFICLSLWLFSIAPDHEWRQGTIELLLVYGAVILSFLGGARWGLALSRPGVDEPLDLSLAILPALVGWLAPFIPTPYAFAVMAVAFAAHGAWDTLAVHNGKAPVWYGRLRSMLTMIVVLAMIVAFFATG